MKKRGESLQSNYCNVSAEGTIKIGAYDLNVVVDC